MIKISKRLEAISTFVPNGANVIDIGCDHGILSIYLYQLKTINKIIASDVNKNALNNAIKNIKKNNVPIETRLGNGLDVLKKSDNIDTVVIAGMGAHTIVEILNNNIDKLDNVSSIIIQSNNKIDFLRKEMSKLNYIVSDEEIIFEGGNYYIIVKFSKGKKKYTDAELHFGPILIKKNSDTFREYNKIELDKLKMLLNYLPKNRIIDRYKIKKKIKLYNKI